MGWVRLYPTGVATFDQVNAEVESYVEALAVEAKAKEERDAAAAAEAASKAPAPAPAPAVRHRGVLALLLAHTVDAVCVCVFWAE